MVEVMDRETGDHDVEATELGQRQPKVVLLHGNRIDSGDGTIGALMKDRELYDRLNRTVRNANELTEKLKPILDDARVFSDKVARHPGSIIRDAVKPGPGLK